MSIIGRNMKCARTSDVAVTKGLKLLKAVKEKAAV
jgi:hypothetical protein